MEPEVSRLMMEKSVWYIVALIGLISCLAYGGKLFALDEQRLTRCKAWASLAVSIQRDLKSGIAVNVLPSMEAFKQMVADFKGPEKELHEFVVSDCMGTRV